MRKVIRKISAAILKHHKASNMPKNTDTCLTPFIVLNSVP